MMVSWRIRDTNSNILESYSGDPQKDLHQPGHTGSVVEC